MSKIRDGVAEFELVLGNNKESQMKGSILPAAGRHKSTLPPRKRNALGRGLSALMSASAVEVEPTSGNVSMAAAAEQSSGKALPPAPGQETGAAETRAEMGAEIAAEGVLIYLNIEQLHANPNQPRQRFAQQEIDELAESITRTGLLQPILARRISGGDELPASFQIVAGERRFRAAQQAGLRKLPVQVRQLDDREVLEVSIIENIQRSQLDPLEEAEAYQRLKAEFGLSQDEIAETVGKDRTTVANALRLLKLGQEARAALIEGRLSAGHSRALLGINDERRQAIAVKQVLKSGLSVRATEELVRRLLSPAAGPGGKSPGRRPSSSPQVQQLEERFRRALGTKVQLRLENSGEGELTISFFSQEELEKLLELMNA